MSLTETCFYSRLYGIHFFKFPYNFCGDFGFSGVHVIPVIITCTLQGMFWDTGIPRNFYGWKICSVGTCVAILWRHDQKFSLEMDLWKTAKLLLFDWIHESFFLFFVINVYFIGLQLVQVWCNFIFKINCVQWSIYFAIFQII